MTLCTGEASGTELQLRDSIFLVLLIDTLALIWGEGRSKRDGWRDWVWGMKNESGVYFTHTGPLHISADWDFLEGKEKKQEREMRDKGARKNGWAKKRCCARSPERKGRRRELSPRLGQHTLNTPQLFPLLFFTISPFFPTLSAGAAAAVPGPALFELLMLNMSPVQESKELFPALGLPLLLW